MSSENSTLSSSQKMEPDFKQNSIEILVDFDGDDDPYRPLNWPMRKKVVVTFLYSLCTMGTTWASTMSVTAPHAL